MEVQPEHRETLGAPPALSIFDPPAATVSDPPTAIVSNSPAAVSSATRVIDPPAAIMSYSLETTKRKFHRLLDSIANSSTKSLPTKISSSDLPPSKRIRLARTHSATMSSSTSSPNVLRVSNTRAGARQHAGTTVTILTDEERVAPFRPWDRAQFLERLKTFSAKFLWWGRKPDNVNAVAWAKRGWKLVDRETVWCAACGKRVMINMDITEPKSWEEDGVEVDILERAAWRWDTQKELAERYEQEIVKGHGIGCPWIGSGCDGNLASTAFLMRLMRLQREYSNYHWRFLERASRRSSSDTNRYRR